MQLIDLLKRTDLRLRLLVDGDLTRTIRWVHVSESRDPSRYLRGGEVVLSSGVWYTGPQSIEMFIGGLARVGIAALGFGINADVPEVPEQLVQAARTLGVVLFEVPDDLPFIAVSEAFVEAWMSAHERPLRDSANRNSELVQILQRGEGLGALLQVLVRSSRGSAAVIARDGVLAQAGPHSVPDEVLQWAGSDQEGAIPTTGFVAYRIPAGPAAAMLVVEQSEEPQTLDQRAKTSQVLAFLAIEVQRLRSMREAARRYAAELFDLIDAGSEQYMAAAARLRSLGFVQQQPLVALCVEMRDADPEGSMLAVEGWLAARRQPSVAAVKTNQILALLAVPADSDLVRIAASLHSALGGALVVGIGMTATDWHRVRDSVIEARHACRFAARRRQVGYAAHDALASHAVLLAMQPDQALSHFEDALLRSVANHDAQHHTDLVNTLETFLSSSGQYQASADLLHVHVNTLRQRLARIAELTGRDLSRMDDRVDFWLALQARDLRAENARAQPNG